MNRADMKIQHWKQSFLDLSSRNPQLNFNPQKYIEIIHPDLETIFKILVVLNQKATLPSVYAGAAKKKKKTTKDASNDNELDKNDASAGDASVDDSEGGSTDVRLKKLTSAHRTALLKKLEKARLTEFYTSITDRTLNSRIEKFNRNQKEAETERGVNILYLTLGLLKWSPKGEKSSIYSPILFIPVIIHKKPREIEILDDSVFVNPVLREKLLGERVKLPRFPEEFDSRVIYDFFKDTQRELFSSWEIEERVFFGSFDFTKVALYQDLENHEKTLLSHPIVRAIAEEEGFAEELQNLPRDEDLTDDFNPIGSYLIMDCDSSQWEAVKYVSTGASLVIQGPPGTGKSQCIANMIAECLGAGKRVLFVAQKQAALNVVHSRLTKCGIGEYCLQIHSQNANKHNLLKNIEESLELQPKLPKVDEGVYQEYQLLRRRLNEYVEFISQPFGNLEMSIDEIMGKILSLEETPLIEISVKNSGSMDLEKLSNVKDLFEQLEQFRDTLENFDKNPWSYAKITNPLVLSTEIKSILHKALLEIASTTNTLTEEYAPFTQKFTEDYVLIMETQSEWERVLHKTKYWLYVIEKILEPWSELDDLISQVSDFFVLDSIIDWKSVCMAFRSLKQINLAYKSRPSEGQSITAYLNVKIREYIKKIDAFNNRIVVFNLKSQLKPLRSKEDLFEFKKFFDNYRSRSLALDCDLLLSRFTIEYTSSMKRMGAQFKVDKELILSCQRVENPKANPKQVLNIIKLFQDKFGKLESAQEEYLQELLKEFYEIGLEWGEFQDLENNFRPLLLIDLLPRDLDMELFTEIIGFTEEWLENLPHLNDWFEITVKEHHIRDSGFGDLFDALKNRVHMTIPSISSTASSTASPSEKASFAQVFEKAYYSFWLADLVESLPPIENFNEKFHLRTVEKFRALDKKIYALNQIRLQQKLADLRPQSDLEISNSLLAQIGFIKREVKKKRNVKPLRGIFSEAKDLISIYKPCIMTSPLAIANCFSLDDYNQYFDVIIFDEASQVTPEDAIGAIMRGKSLVVVGDSKQLPPTNFFSAKISGDFGDGEDLDTNIQTMESLLDECTGIGFREKLLKFHYRSRKEGLIAFSNQNYYNGQLYSFPDLSSSSTETKTTASTLGDGGDGDDGLDNLGNINSLPAIEFRHVKGGTKVKGTNVIEAKAIAGAVLDHYRANVKHGTNFSIGVIAFSMAQQKTILQELDKLLKKDPEAEALFIQKREEEFFIKNLENVQGDERDFILFSIGYAKGPNGKLTYNFGPLNRSGGFRRLNVAITRARYHIKIFCSFLPREMQKDRIKARGLMDLVNYMEFAQTGELDFASV